MAWQDFLRNNSDALMRSGAGLLNGGTGGEQLAQGIQGFADGRKQTRTLQFLKSANPELAQAVEAGLLTGGDAFKMHYTQKLEAEKPKKPIEVGGRLVDPTTYDVLADFSTPAKPQRSFQTLPDGTYGVADLDGGSFSPLGRAPKAGSGDVSQREIDAARLGLGKDDPAYQSYVLTGKMPREDAQTLTATDKKAILESDEMVSAAEGTIPLLDRALQLNNSAYSGPMAGSRGYLTGTFGSDAGQATLEFDNLVQSQALSQLKAIFGAAPTEGERKILMDISGSSNQPPEVRKHILERAKVAVERRRDLYSSRSNDLRGGTFYKPNGGGGGSGGGRTSSGLSWRPK